MRTFKLCFLACALAALASVGARADEPSAPPPPRGVHFHDGFYFRFATGFGGYSESLHRAGDARDATVSGIASVGELAIGHAVRPGIIIGFGVYGSTLLASDRTPGDSMPPPEVWGGGGYGLAGPFVDWYTDPAGGLHLEAAIGVSARGYDVESGKVASDKVAVGGGIMLGFGYEWWISPQWSIGVLGRVTGVFASGDADDGTSWNHSLGTSPSLLFTATYN